MSELHDAMLRDIEWLRDNDIELRQGVAEWLTATRFIKKYLGERSLRYSVIEVGVFKGASLLLLSNLVAEGSAIVAVDVGTRKGVDDCMGKVMALLEQRKFKPLWVRENSHYAPAITGTEAALGSLGFVGCTSASIVHIDGDHTHIGSLLDVFAFSRFVKFNGVVMMHDVAAKSCQARKTWVNIQRLYPETTFTFNDRTPSGGAERYATGIGVWIP